MAKLPANATKEQIRDTHKEKMRAKDDRRQSVSDRYKDRSPILANISAHHEHWGDTPMEHWVRKNNS